MTQSSEEFVKACEQAKTSQDGAGPYTVRQLLGWFGVARRGSLVVQQIADALEREGVETVPGFNETHLDGELHLLRATKEAAPVDDVAPAMPSYQPETRVDKPRADRALHIGRLQAAGTLPELVAPDASIEEVISLMLLRNLSQVPVGSTLRSVKGVISWRSLAKRMGLGSAPRTAREAMDAAVLVRSSDRLLDAVQVIAANQYALVQGHTGAVVGMVTATDLTGEFQQLTEPYLLIGEIEDLLRRLLDYLDPEALQQVRHPGDEKREVQQAADLNFGEYLRAFEQHWKPLCERSGLRLHRKVLLAELVQVNEIRNSVMHFDTDPFHVHQLETLRRCLKLLKEDWRVRGEVAA